jgi:PPOX class probable FMN-dependent enzyme
LHDLHAIRSLGELERLYPVKPIDTALAKELDRIHPMYAKMIEASPFAVPATIGPGGLDASPRGDPPGFVLVENERTLLLPERRGNNRIDSLRNIVADPRVALLFLIPGLSETLRVNGRATIDADPGLCARFAIDGAAPKCVLRVAVETVFFQCARAIQRSGLWRPPAADVREHVPTAGQILGTLSAGRIDGARYDAELPARHQATLYRD